MWSRWAACVSFMILDPVTVSTVAFTKAPNHLNQLVLSHFFKETTSKPSSLFSSHTSHPFIKRRRKDTGLLEIMYVNSIMIYRGIMIYRCSLKDELNRIWLSKVTVTSQNTFLAITQELMTIYHSWSDTELVTLLTQSSKSLCP